MFQVRGDAATEVSDDQFSRLFEVVNDWRPPGRRDERRAVGRLTARKAVVATGLVRDGVGVALRTPRSTQAAPVNAIDVLEDGLVGRGVLLDIPRVRDVPWLEPGELVWRDDLEAAERDEGIRVAEGDVLLVRTGHARRLGPRGAWDSVGSRAALHPTAMRFIAERGVAALGSDGSSDTAPSSTECAVLPIDTAAFNAMGVHLLDDLQFEDLREACERAGRWEFLFAAAPLRSAGGTGPLVSPIAIL